MPIAQDIALSPHRKEPAAAQFQPTRRTAAGEEDLFHKFILDKESASVEGDKAVFDQQALDNEEVETNGFLSAREQHQVDRNLERKQAAPSARKSVAHGHKGLPGAKVTAQGVGKAPRHSASAKPVEPEAGRSQKPANAKGVVFQLSAKAASTSQLPTQASPAKQASAQPPMAKMDASKSGPGMAKLASRTRPVQEKPSTQPVLHNRAESAAKVDSSVTAKGQEQGESSSSNSNGQGSPDPDTNGRQPNLTQPETALPVLQPDTAQPNSATQQFAQAAQSSLPQGGAYAGAVSQLAQQIFRLQQSGQSGTTRLTLDLPDGEKLLVRFHVRPGQGMQVQFSTGSRGLRDSIRQSWDSLRTEATQRGILLDDPQFEGTESISARR